MEQLGKQLRWILSWMSDVGYQSPHELTPDVVGRYLDQLPNLLADRSKDGEVGLTTAALSLNALMHLWNQRNALARMKVNSLPRHPFNGSSVNIIAKGLATKAKRWIQPLPDEVAIPLLNKATWFLGVPADDVLELLGGMSDPPEGSRVVFANSERAVNGAPRVTGLNAVRISHTMRFLESFGFSTVDGESGPWHEPLDWEFEQSSERHGERFSRVRELWDAIRDAAAIVVQATAGMRLSELLGILAGIDVSSGLPNGVRLELSPTGLYEWFVIRSQLFKDEDGIPREVDWVLGMRPTGSKEIPFPVRALYILNQLYEPWRATARTDRLILASQAGRALPLPSASLGPMHIDRMNESMQRFIDRWVDLSELPNESARKTEDNDLVRWRELKGKEFRTYMLRKAWAQFTLACDSRLLPAIQMQFHHANLAMTETGYIGNNPLLLDDLDSMSTQKTNLAVFDIIVGKSKLTGRMGDQLEKALTKFRAEAGDLPTSEKWLRAVQWVDRNVLKMFFTPHATCCPTRTSEMKCHDEVNTPVLLRKGPNTATRAPSLCIGCSCAIMDKSHEPFWSDRYVGYEVSLRQADKAGIHPGPFREIQFRADQARTILKKFDADFVALDARVTTILEAGHAKT
jgi:hypothetical protein